MKIFVTGAYGQLGNEIREQINRFPKWEFLFTDIDSLDITSEKDVQAYFAENNPDIVVNCAAYTAVDKAESDAEIAEKVNALSPKLLGKYSRIAGAKVIHISTDYVFDGAANQPYVETDKVNPQGIYGASKLRGEQNCMVENPESIIIRTSWLYLSLIHI